MAQLQATTIHASGSVRLGRTPDTSHTGLMWYDSGSAKLHFTKCILVPGTPGTPGGSGTWSSAGSVPVGRYNLAGAGVQNAGLVTGGRQYPTTPWDLSCTDEYNGTSYSAGGALNRARNGLAGTGTQNSALVFGGSPNGTCTEEYNGSTWSFGGTVPRTTVGKPGLAGTQNAAVGFAGTTNAGGTCTDEYNGTSWTSANAMSGYNKWYVGYAGTSQNAALSFGGSICGNIAPYYTCQTEEYNGTTWSSGGNMNVLRSGMGGSGEVNSALAFGGIVPPVLSSTATEEYNADACYRKHFYTQQNTVYADQLYVSGSSTVEAVFNLANRTDTPSPLTAGTVWQSGSAGAGCLYFTPDGSSICKISFA